MSIKTIVIISVIVALIVLAVIFWPKPSAAPESGNTATSGTGQY